MNRSLLFGCLDDGPGKPRTTQTSNPVGWKEERMGRSGKQNWKDTWGFWHLILIWVGNHFFPHHQAILRTRAGYWLRTTLQFNSVLTLSTQSNVSSHRCRVQSFEAFPHGRQQSQVKVLTCAAMDQWFQ